MTGRILQMFNNLFDCCLRFNEESILRNIDRFNVERAGVQPAVTNVVLTHGMADPWRSIGVQETLGELAPVYVIPSNIFFSVFIKILVLHRLTYIFFRCGT